MSGNNIHRDRSFDVLTKTGELETLITFKNFPVFMGCVDTPAEDDVVVDMNWKISKETGIVQIDPIVDESYVYLASHGSGTVGNIWNNHHKLFSEFVSNSGNDILEIGSSHGILFSILDNSKLKFTIVEPNYIGPEADNITVVRKFFNSELDLNKKFDTIVHSHVFEHIFDYDEFLLSVKKHLRLGGKMLFSVPNFDYMIQTDQFPLNFEHTVLITDYYIKYLLTKHGFEIDKEYMYLNHSKFYSAVFKEDTVKDIPLISTYEEHKKKIRENYNKKKEDVDNINSVIDSSYSDTKIYLYSGHIFSQYLINLGLDVNGISCILDNDPNKETKRLYGTDLMVNKPSVIKDDRNPFVILRSGVYNQEIENQLKEINPNVTII